MCRRSKLTNARALGLSVINDSFCVENNLRRTLTYASTSKSCIYKLIQAVVLTGYKMVIVLFLCYQNYYVFDKLKAVDNMIDDVFEGILVMFKGGS